MRKLAVIALASLFVPMAAVAQLKVSTQTAVAAPAPAQAEPPLESARRIPRDEAIKLVKAKKAVFVDVRPKEAYDAGHIKGSRNIPLSDLISRIKELPPKQMIITYCA